MPNNANPTTDFDSAFEDVAIGVSTPFEERLVENKAAQEYFDSVDDTTARNYVMAIRDMHEITFDRFTELNRMIDKTSKFLPKSQLFPKPTKADWTRP